MTLIFMSIAPWLAAADADAATSTFFGLSVAGLERRSIDGSRLGGRTPSFRLRRRLRRRLRFRLGRRLERDLLLPARALAVEVQRHRCADERLQRGLVEPLALVNVDG